MPGFPSGGLGYGFVLAALIGLLIWIVILVWLSERILRFIGIRTGWRPLDWRNLLTAFVLLTGAVHFGNFAIDRIEVLVSGVENHAYLGMPGAFLIGSVAIGVGIAAVRWHRQQKR
ncbi:MAG: hypothetical protein WAT93_07940 [Pontixanthobacter sp.]